MVPLQTVQHILPSTTYAGLKPMLNAWISHYFAVLAMLNRPKTPVFDTLGMTHNNKVSFWCIYEQMEQTLLSLPLRL